MQCKNDKRYNLCEPQASHSESRGINNTVPFLRFKEHDMYATRGMILGHNNSSYHSLGDYSCSFLFIIIYLNSSSFRQVGIRVQMGNSLMSPCNLDKHRTRTRILATKMPAKHCLQGIFVPLHKVDPLELGESQNHHV